MSLRRETVCKLCFGARFFCVARYKRGLCADLGQPNTKLATSDGSVISFNIRVLRRFYGTGLLT